MAIKDFELYHGAVLTRILRKDIKTSLKLVETNKDSSSTYIINDEIALYITYRSPIKTDKHLRWSFSFSENQLKEINKYSNYKLMFALACINKEYEGYNSEICILSEEEILKLIDLNAINDQRINVYLEKGKSFRVDGTLNPRTKKLTVSKNRINNLELPE